MYNTIITAALTTALLASKPVISPASITSANLVMPQKEEILSSEELDLSKRFAFKNISDGFKENILINVGYLLKDWPNGEIVLEPGEVFAYHKYVLPEYKNNKIITQDSGFSAKEGYKTIAGLDGNGVCHLATLMNWVGQEAGLEVKAPTNHDFAPVPGVDREYGTAIYYIPGGGSDTERQNLYIKNTKDYPIKMAFALDGDRLKFTIKK